MTLIDGIQHNGHPFYIPDVNRLALPEFFSTLGFQIGAEIGVYKGKFCEKFCLAGMTMYAIDPWSGEGDQKMQTRQDYLFAYACSVLRRTKRGHVIRKPSMDAMVDFADNSLDFVYIDGDHRYEGIYADIHGWFAKVRSGGVISGHDYAYTGTDLRAIDAYNASTDVSRVVRDFIAKHKIQNFYTFGRTKPIEFESKNDRYLSWMFFKP